MLDEGPNLMNLHDGEYSFFFSIVDDTVENESDHFLGSHLSISAITEHHFNIQCPINTFQWPNTTHQRPNVNQLCLRFGTP